MEWDWNLITCFIPTQDLVEVNNGAFNDRLKKLVKFAIKHVKQCPVSLSK